MGQMKCYIFDDASKFCKSWDSKCSLMDDSNNFKDFNK